MKKERSYAPPSSAGLTSGKGQRLRPSGKHAKGHAAKVSFGQPVNPGFPKGAHKKRLQKAAVRLRLLSETSRDANRIANERALRKAYAEFYSTPDGRAFARAEVKSASARKKADKNVDFADPAELPDSVGCGSHNGRKLVRMGEHPIDQIEPRKQFAVEVEGLSDFEIQSVSESFGDLLRWALDDDDIVARGRRAIVLIAAMRPDLAAGMHPDKGLMLELARNCTSADSSFDILHSFQAAGAVYGRFLEWIGRGPIISAIGERLDMTAYMLRPDLLPQNTLAKLGEILNKSRQAKDKLANCLRDTLAGLKALAMRPEITRDRCRTAQLSPS